MISILNQDSKDIGIKDTLERSSIELKQSISINSDNAFENISIINEGNDSEKHSLGGSLEIIYSSPADELIERSDTFCKEFYQQESTKATFNLAEYGLNSFDSFYSNFIKTPEICSNYLASILEHKNNKELWTEVCVPDVNSESLLSDILVSTHSLIGHLNEDDKVWNVSSMEDDPTMVSLKDIKSYLMIVFNKTEDEINGISNTASKKTDSELALNITIVEAKDLQKMNTNGSANAFVTIAHSEGKEKLKTKIDKETFTPQWNETFTIDVKDVVADYVTLEMWHVSGVSSQMKHVKGPKTFKRFIKTLKTTDNDDNAKCIGKTVIYLKDIGGCGIDTWLSISKEKHLNQSRGYVSVNAFLRSKKPTVVESRHTYEAILARMIDQNTDGSREQLCKLQPAASAILAHQAIMLGISKEMQQLSWWFLGCRILDVDNEWILNQLQIVQKSLDSNHYLTNDVIKLRKSFAICIRNAVKKIQNLHQSFTILPEHKKKLTVMLKILQSLENHGKSRRLLDDEGVPDLTSLILHSLITYTHKWWSTLLSLNFKTVDDSEDLLRDAIAITTGISEYIGVASAYNQILMEVWEINYLECVHCILTNKLEKCARPVIDKLCSKMPTRNDLENSIDLDEYSIYAGEAGNTLWSLYIKIGVLKENTLSLSKKMQAESSFLEYHRWFSKAVMCWIDFTICSSQRTLQEAEELDDLEPCNMTYNYSSSAVVAVEIIKTINIWWKKLNWPSPENSGFLLSKLLSGLCKCFDFYSGLLHDRIQILFTPEVYTSKNACVALNCIYHVKARFCQLSDYFMEYKIIEDIKQKNLDMYELADKIKETNQKIISIAEDEIHVKLQYTIINQFIRGLEKYIVDSSKTDSNDVNTEDNLLSRFQVIQCNIDANYFCDFLRALWEEILLFFSNVITKKENTADHSYFTNIRIILEECVKVCTNNLENTLLLTYKDAKSLDYNTILNKLESLGMNLGSLICRYYNERLVEQNNLTMENKKAELVCRAYFKSNNKLATHVILTKDMIETTICCDCICKSGFCVKIHLEPKQWFPNQKIHKTKEIREIDSVATFDESCEFNIDFSSDDLDGFVLFSLYRPHCCCRDTFIAEAVIALKDLPTVNNDMKTSVRNLYLDMGTPSPTLDYVSLKVLRLQPKNKDARILLKKESRKVK